MDRGYDSRVGSSLDVQEIDSGQPLSLTLQQHGLGGLFLFAAQTRTIVRSLNANIAAAVDTRRKYQMILFLLFFLLTGLQ